MSLVGILGILIWFYHLFSNINPIGRLQNSISNYGENINPKKEYEVVVENSLFKGLSKDLEPYEIYSKYAYKSVDNKYRLDQINANYKLSKQNLLIFAKEGLIDDDKKLLVLKNNIELILDELKIYSSELNIDLISKDTNSRSGVKLKYKNSIVDADSFNSEENNQSLNFKGHVKTKLNFADF